MKKKIDKKRFAWKNKAKVLALFSEQKLQIPKDANLLADPDVE